MNNSIIFPEMVDGFAVQPNGEMLLIGQVPIPPDMKIKDIVRSYFGWDEDPDSDAMLMFYMVKEFQDWYDKQNSAIVSIPKKPTPPTPIKQSGNWMNGLPEKKP